VYILHLDSHQTMSLGPRAAIDLAKKLGVFPRPKPAIAEALNGVGAYIVPCTKMTLLYSHSRKGTGLAAQHVVQFIKGELPTLARESPSIEFCVQATPNSPPLLVAEYIGGRTRQRELKGLGYGEIRKKFLELRDMSGKKEGQYKRIMSKTKATEFMTRQ